MTIYDYATNNKKRKAKAKSKLEMTEAELEKRVCNRLRGMGFLCLKLSSYRSNGFPDRTIISNRGKVVFVEFKSPSGKGRLSHMQSKVIDQLRTNGCKVSVQTDVEEAVHWVQEQTMY